MIIALHTWLDLLQLPLLTPRIHRLCSGTRPSPAGGNACFYGYSIDLLARVAADLGFRYTLYEVPDGRYGSLNEYTRQWDGMVNELIPGKNGLTVSSLNPEFILRHPVGTSWISA